MFPKKLNIVSFCMNDSSPSNEIQDDLVYMALYVHVNAGKKAGRIKKLTNPSIVQLLGGEVEKGAEQKEESFFLLFVVI